MMDCTWLLSWSCAQRGMVEDARGWKSIFEGVDVTLGTFDNYCWANRTSRKLEMHACLLPAAWLCDSMRAAP
jgi:hypothetical protein